MSTTKIQPGDVFGRWTVLKRIASDDHSKTRDYWHCRCECGKTKLVHRGNLFSGKTRSCGCLHREEQSARATTHGHSRKDGKGTPEHVAWCGIKTRCFNKNASSYKHYGGRGIMMHQQWQNSFETFFADVGPCPGKGYSIDRFPDNNGNYEPNNVRWATAKEQTRNMRTNRILTLGDESMPLAAWAERVGMSNGTLWSRLAIGGWSVEKALTTPVRGC